MQRMKRLSWLVFVIALAGCGGGDGGGGSGTTTSGGEAAYAGPIASTDVARGQQVYEQSCNGCHPSAGAGYGPVVRDIHWTVAHMRMQIREGKGRMPAFAATDMDADSLEALLAYLSSIGAVQAE